MEVVKGNSILILSIHELNKEFILNTSLTKRRIIYSLLAIFIFANIITAQGYVKYNHEVGGAFYTGVDVGYVNRNWDSAIDTTTVTQTNWRNMSGGFTAGADFGYLFNDYIGLELGWNYLPEMLLKINCRSTCITTDRVSSSFYYSVFKFLIPVSTQNILFFKLGASYVKNQDYPNPSFTLIHGIKSNYWSGILATGLQTYVGYRSSISIEAAYIPALKTAQPTYSQFTVPQSIMILVVGEYITAGL